MNQHLKLLGWRVKDIITGIEGVVTSVDFNLYGCVQAIVQAAADEKGIIPDGRWFDVSRLAPIGERPVMAPILSKFELEAAVTTGPCQIPHVAGRGSSLRPGAEHQPLP